MIVKKISSKKATGSFGGLADYLLDKLQLHKDKVESYSFSNCLDDLDGELLDTDLNISIVENLQAISPSKSDKTMHLMVSFQEDERPTKEKLKEIEKELLKSIGMEHHQRLSVTHDNTNNYHMHIAVNRIDPETYKRVDPRQDVPKLHKKAAELEEKFNLKRDNHIPNRDLAAQAKERKTKEESQTYTKEQLDERHRANRPDYDRAGDTRRATLYQSSTSTDGRVEETQSITSVRDLSELDMVQDTQSLELLLQGDALDSVEGISSTDHGVRREGESYLATDDGDRSGTRSTENGRIRESQKQKDIQAHSGVSNLIEWIKENASEELKSTLKNASELKEVHETLAKYNLEIKERGNGLIIKDKHRGLFIKASAIHRDFSKEKFEEKFGKFEPMDIKVEPTTRFGIQKHDFWEKYHKEKEEIKEEKKEELAKLKDHYTECGYRQ